MAPKKKTVMVVAAESTDSFYVMDEELEDAENDLQNKFQTIAEKEPAAQSLKVNKVYFAKVEGRWCRAKVMEVKNDNKCIVQLIDFGKSTVVDDSKFRNISGQLAELTPKVLKCVLDFPKDHPINKSDWKDDAFKFLVSNR